MTREEAIALMKRNADGYYPKMTEALDMAIKALEQEPAYKVGKWIKQTLIMPLSDSTRDCVMCSECKTHWELEYKYCPNCGAKMVESEEI